MVCGKLKYAYFTNYPDHLSLEIVNKRYEVGNEENVIIATYGYAGEIKSWQMTMTVNVNVACCLIQPQIIGRWWGTRTVLRTNLRILTILYVQFYLSEQYSIKLTQKRNLCRTYSSKFAWYKH